MMGPLGIPGRNSLPATRSATRICGRRAHERLRAMRTPSVQAGSGHARAKYASGSGHARVNGATPRRSTYGAGRTRKQRPRTQAPTHPPLDPFVQQVPSEALRAGGWQNRLPLQARSCPSGPVVKKALLGEFLIPFAYYFAPFAAIGRKGLCEQ